MVERRGHKGIWWDILRERDLLDDLGVDRKLILRWIFRVGCGGMGWIDLAEEMDWIELAQDRDRWRAFVNVVMNFRVP
jgi:hypothetical protein